MITIIVGPTGSGKTDFSIDLARKTGAKIINCDSLQFYKDIPTLTAAPNDIEKSMAPHMLFSCLNYDEDMNGVQWARNVANIIAENDRNVIIVGGTFLYIEILLIGVSELPDITSDIRNYVDGIAKTNFSKIIDDLYSIDSNIKDIIMPDKHKQLRRAYEIYLATGKSILEFYRKPRKQFIQIKDDIEIVVIDVDKTFLHKKIEKRFYKMIELGAIDEVKVLLSKTYNSTNYKIFNAIGAREITSMLSGKIDYDVMISNSISRTKQYIKRQLTWIKNKINMYNVNVVKTPMTKWHL